MRVNDAYFFKLDQIVSTMGVSFLIIPSLNRFIIQSSEERKASHDNFPSEPHSPHFLVRATSESLFFDYFVLKSFQFLKIKLYLF